MPVCSVLCSPLWGCNDNKHSSSTPCSLLEGPCMMCECLYDRHKKHRQKPCVWEACCAMLVSHHATQQTLNRKRAPFGHGSMECRRNFSQQTCCSAMYSNVIYRTTSSNPKKHNFQAHPTKKSSDSDPHDPMPRTGQDLSIKQKRWHVLFMAKPSNTPQSK